MAASLVKFLLLKVVIPMMRFNERTLYGNHQDTRLLFSETKEKVSGSIFDILPLLTALEYQSRPATKNYLQHPGYTLKVGTGICKDVAFLIKALSPRSHYIEIWKTATDGHVYIVLDEHVIDFTSKCGIRIRERKSDNPIDAAAFYYGDFIFAKENDKILSKYGM